MCLRVCVCVRVCVHRSLGALLDPQESRVLCRTSLGAKTTNLEFSLGGGEAHWVVAGSSPLPLACLVHFLLFAVQKRRRTIPHSGSCSNRELCCCKLLVGFQREVRFHQPGEFSGLQQHQRVTCSEARWRLRSQDAAQRKTLNIHKMHQIKAKYWTLDLWSSCCECWPVRTVLHTDSPLLSATINHHFQAPTH